jgi:hypothetical protein
MRRYAFVCAFAMAMMVVQGVLAGPPTTTCPNGQCPRAVSVAPAYRYAAPVVATYQYVQPTYYYVTTPTYYVTAPPVYRPVTYAAPCPNGQCPRR